MIVNVITKPLMKLEHPEDLSFFYQRRTFLYKKILSCYVRVLNLSLFLPPFLNNVGLTQPPEAFPPPRNRTFQKCHGVTQGAKISTHPFFLQKIIKNTPEI